MASPKKKKKRASTEPRPETASAPPESVVLAPREPTPALPTLSARDAWLDRALVLVAMLVTFGRSLPYPLVPSWDDQRFLIDDPLVTQPSWASFVSIWTEPHFEAYHPLHLLSYWIDVPWLGAVGTPIRVTSLLLFAAAGFAMLSWLRALGIGRLSAVLATLVFVLHPVQVELVVWGTGRKDVLAALFAMLAWTAHLRSTSAWDRSAWLSRAAFAAACLSKTSAVTLPLAMFAADLWLARLPWREAALRQLPGVVLAAVLGAITIGIWRGNEMIRPVEEAGSSATLVLASLSHALTTLAFPARVSPLYAMVEDDPPSPLFLGLGVVVVGALLFLAWSSRETRAGRLLGVGVTTFLAIYLPVANLVPTYYEFQDRHLSLPLIGLVVVLASVLDRGRDVGGDKLTPGIAILGLACVLPLAVRTMQYEAVWSSDARLWAHATTTHRRSYYAWIKLGEVRRDEGRFDGAIEAYTRAIEIRPTQRLAHGALLMTLALRDERDLALPPPSHATELVERYLRDVDDADALSRDAGDAALDGYRWAALFFLSRQLDLQPASDERLEHAADVQLRGGHEWLARFYVGRMHRPPLMPRMRRFWDEERARLGLPPLEPPAPEDATP
ncbi:MAG: tetratricopeptide repeat protein [Sandaracinus sp.]